jgi:hypothetical protein
MTLFFHQEHKHGRSGQQITYKVNSNRGNVRLSVGIISKSKQQTRLSYTGVSDKEELEKVIAIGRVKREQTSW